MRNDGKNPNVRFLAHNAFSCQCSRFGASGGNADIYKNVTMIALAAESNGIEHGHRIRYIDIAVAVNICGTKRGCRQPFFLCDVIKNKHSVGYIDLSVAVGIAFCKLRQRRVGFCRRLFSFRRSRGERLRRGIRRGCRRLGLRRRKKRVGRQCRVNQRAFQSRTVGIFSRKKNERKRKHDQKHRRQYAKQTFHSFFHSFFPFFLWFLQNFRNSAGNSALLSQNGSLRYVG